MRKVLARALRASNAESRPAVVSAPRNARPRLLDRARDLMRFQRYSIRTEESYLNWMKRFILFHGKRHPGEMGTREVREFLTDLAVNGKVSASTQNQALSALLFLYQQVLEK